MRLITNLIVLCAIFGAQATVPTGYYDSLNGLSGKDLKDAIHTLTANHTKLTYGDLWEYFPDTDCYPGTNRVWDMYSNITYYFSSSLGTATSGMNKEHSVPNSWWGGSKTAPYSDLFHLFPVDEDANTARANYPFGEVATVNWDNGLSKNGTPVSGQGGGCDYVFEPADEYKGDFARVYFYFVCCYQDCTWKWKYMFDDYDDNWKTLNDWSVELLLRWARQDPVSEKEINRNEAVYNTAQGNRNPFVDNPDLMEYIWGDMYGTAWGGSTSLTGDVNQDGMVDVTDVNIVVNIVLGGISSSSYPLADTNGDGMVDVTDVNIIVNLILGSN